MGKQQQLTLAEEVRDRAVNELYPGETMLALCTFFGLGKSTRLLSLTEGNLRYMTPNWSGRSFGRVETRSLDRSRASRLRTSRTSHSSPIMTFSNCVGRVSGYLSD